MDFNIVQSYLLKLPEVETLKRLEKVKEVSSKYSDKIVDEYLKRIIDARHKKIVAAEDEFELQKLDFSYDYYIERLKKELVVEKGRPFKKIINCTGMIYSGYMGDRLYSEEVMNSFEEVFSGYNNLELDEEKGEYIEIDKEINKFLAQILKGRDYLLTNSMGSAIYLLINSLYKNEKILMGLGDTFYLSNGMGVQDIVSMSGGNTNLIGYINKVTESDYIEKIETGNELVVYTDMFENTIGSIKRVGIDGLKKIKAVADTVFITDRAYIYSEADEIKFTGINLENLILQGFKFYIIDISKFIGGPEVAIIVGDFDKIAKIRENFLAKILVPNKETKVLLYFTMKMYMEKRYNDIYINKCFNISPEKLRDKNRRFVRNIEREIGEKVEMGISLQKVLKINEKFSDEYSFERETINIRPLTRNAKDIERELRMNDPSVLCWLNGDTLVFNLQLVREEQEDLIVDLLSKKI